MRLSRRSVLLGAGLAAAAGVGGRAYAQRPQALEQPTPIEIRATPIDHLSAGEANATRFGALTFRGGLDLEGPLSAFGGLSGLWRFEDGRDLVAVTDSAH